MMWRRNLSVLRFQISNVQTTTSAEYRPARFTPPGLWTFLRSNRKFDLSGESSFTSLIEVGQSNNHPVKSSVTNIQAGQLIIKSSAKMIRVTKCRAITPVTITQITVGHVVSPGQNWMKYNCSDSKLIAEFNAVAGFVLLFIHEQNMAVSSVISSCYTFNVNEYFF